MAGIKPGEVSSILKKELEGFSSNAALEEIGNVLQVGDGIARIYGLSNVQANELIEFEMDNKVLCLIWKKTMWERCYWELPIPSKKAIR